MDVFHHNELHKALSAIWDHTISSDFLNEFRVNAANWKFNEIASNPTGSGGASPKTIFFRPVALRSIILVRTRANIFDQWTYTFKDVATKIHGRHTIKFGGEVHAPLFSLDNNTTAGNGVPNYFFFNIWGLPE